MPSAHKPSANRNPLKKPSRHRAIGAPNEHPYARVEQAVRGFELAGARRTSAITPELMESAAIGERSGGPGKRDLPGRGGSGRGIGRRRRRRWRRSRRGHANPSGRAPSAPSPASAAPPLLPPLSPSRLLASFRLMQRLGFSRADSVHH